MKEITYKERSNFYANEVKKNINDIKLLKSIKYKYNISSVIICPCASGVYLNECSKIFKKSYFIDIEKSMIDIVNDNILKNKVDNIKACTHNMVNLKDLKIKYDCIISLNQGIQYLNYSEFEEFLNNNYLVIDYIVLDLFNFNLDGMLPYYNSNIKDGEFYFSKSFMIKNKSKIEFPKGGKTKLITDKAKSKIIIGDIAIEPEGGLKPECISKISFSVEGKDLVKGENKIILLLNIDILKQYR